MDFRDIYRLTVTNQLLSITNRYVTSGDMNLISSIALVIAILYAWFEIQPSDIKKMWVNRFQNRMRDIYRVQTKTHERSVVYMKPHVIMYKSEYGENTKRITSSIKYHGFVDHLQRKYNTKINEYHDSFNYIRFKNHSDRLEYNNSIIFCPGNCDIELSNGIHCHVQYKPAEERINESEVYMSIIELSIEEPGKINIIMNFLKECEQEYLERRIASDKQVGQKIFEYIGKQNDDDDSDDSKQYNVYRFKSNKYLDKNVFFEGQNKMIQYVSQFINSDNGGQSFAEDEYMRSGVTFKAGMLFYGVPGCGKSTTIKAILNLTKRHGVYLNLNRIKTCEEFSNIFRSGKINDIQYGLNELCFILEDFDANHCSVLKRRDEDCETDNDMDEFCFPDNSEEDNNVQDASGNLNSKLKELFKSPKDIKWLRDMRKIGRTNRFGKLFGAVSDSINSAPKTSAPTDDSLTLECVLNVLDGVIELHNAMFIFTTNHPDTIDPALLRPGRIDYRHEFRKASRKVLTDMFRFKFQIDDIEFSKYDFSLYEEESMTPAEIQSIMFLYNKDNIQDCFHNLMNPKV